MSGIFVPAIFILLAVVFLITAAVMLTGRKRKSEICDAATTAIVTDFVKQSSRNIDTDMDTMYTTSYYPVFEYYVAGKKYTERSLVGNSKPRWQKGTSLELRYNSRQPEIFVVPAETDTVQLIARIFIAVGCGLLVAGVLVIRYLSGI